MKTHLPKQLRNALLASLVAVASTVYAESTWNTIGDGSYQYVEADGTTTSTFIGDWSNSKYEGDFNGQSGYDSNGDVGGVRHDDPDRATTNTDITVGDGETATIITRVMGAGPASYAVTGNKTVTVLDKAYVGLIVGATDYSPSHTSGYVDDSGAQSCYKDKQYFSPKAIEGSQITINVEEGAVVGQIRGGNNNSSTRVLYEYANAKKYFEDNSDPDGLAKYLEDPAWALNEKIVIKVNGGKVGYAVGGESKYKGDYTEESIIGAGGKGFSVNNAVEIEVTDGDILGDIYAGAKSFYSNKAAYDEEGKIISPAGEEKIIQSYVGSTKIAISGGTITGNVYAGGSYNDDAALASLVKGNTTVLVSGGTITGNVYGGGDQDEVKGSTNITVSGGTIDGDVYGAGKSNKVGSTNITLLGGVITKTVYGGGTGDYTVEGDRNLNIGSEENAYQGSVAVADFTNIHLKNGEATLTGYTAAEEGTDLKLNGDVALTVDTAVALESLTLAGTGITLTIAESGSLDIGTIILEDAAVEKQNGFYVDANNAIGNNGFGCDSLYVGVTPLSADYMAGYTGEVKDTAGNVYIYTESTGAFTCMQECDYSTYHINEDTHTAKLSEVTSASAGAVNTVQMTTGKLTADNGQDVTVTATGGAIEMTSADFVLKGTVRDTDILASAGAIEAELSGETSLTVKGGEVKVTGDNSQTGAVTIEGKTSKLVVGSEKALGDSAVYLRDHGTLDLGDLAIANTVYVEGCTISGASAYVGDMVVSGDLTLTDEVTCANSVTMKEGASLTGNSVNTASFTVEGTNQTINTDVTIQPGGKMVLNAQQALTIQGSLILGEDAQLVLVGGDFDLGDTLITCTETQTGTFTSVQTDDEILELEYDGNNVKVVGSTQIFNQAIADLVVQGNWGIVSASRTFVGAVQGQRNQMGCIANGRGTAWVSVLGGSSEVDGSGAASGSDMSLIGAAVGADMKVGKRSSLGVAFGYTDSEVSVGSQDVDQTGTYVALYGEHGLRKLSDTSCLSLDWVAAVGSTDSDVDGSEWTQESVQLNGRLRWNKQVNDRLCVNVFGGLEYFASGSDRVDRVKSGSVQNLRGEVGLGAYYTVLRSVQPVVCAEKGAPVTTAGCDRLVVFGELSYMNDLVRHNPHAEVKGLRGTGANPGRQGFGVEVGARLRINERWTAGAVYSFSTHEDAVEHSANIGASYTF